MIIFLTILILLTCVVLGFFILIQNPKDGGLTGALGSMGNQIMGAKQSSNTMEKGTWVTMSIIAALCIFSIAFFPKHAKINNTPKAQTQSSNTTSPIQQQPNTPAQPAQPAN